MRHTSLLATVTCISLAAVSVLAADATALSRQDFERLRANDRLLKDLRSGKHTENELARIDREKSELLSGSSTEKLAAAVEFAANDIRRAVNKNQSSPGSVPELEIERLRGEHKLWRIRLLKAELETLRDENAQLRKRLQEFEEAKWTRRAAPVLPFERALERCWPRSHSFASIVGITLPHDAFVTAERDDF